MGKKGKKDAKRAPKPKSITPPDSEPGTGTGTPTAEEQERLGKENEATSLGLTLGPTRLIAKAPFNTMINPVDTISLWSNDRVEFIVSRSLLSIASRHFCNLLASQEEGIDEPTSIKFKLRPCTMFDWELEPSFIIEMDESSNVLDPLLRFIYPVPSPVFKEPVTSNAINELPYRLIGPIYDAARKYEFSYVRQRILEIARDLIYIKSMPEQGLSALRAYGVACRLKLDGKTKLKAARNALCVPYKVSPTTGLEDEGISKVDIQRCADFHKQALEVLQEFFQISQFDAYPVGLSDVYATFVACPQCNGIPPSANTIRCGAARWWQLYAANALERLRRAPLDPSIFQEGFLVPVFREAQNCSACAAVVHWKWCNMMPMLAQAIPAKVYEVPLETDGENSEEIVHEIESNGLKIEGWS